MKKSCPYCGRIHEKGFQCPKKPAFQSKNDVTEITCFRSSANWQKTRNFIVKRDRFLCRICLENGVFTSGDLEVHHITPLAVDFSKRLDADNLITLCPKHHEDAERGAIEASHLRELAGADIPPAPTLRKSSNA